MSLKHAILGFLSFSPLTGYDLKKSFDRSVRHFWPANQSQIYRTLADLDAEGLIDKDVISREDRLDMKIYRLTERGQAELHRWLSTPLPPQDNREPFLIQIFFGGQLSDDELLGVLRHELREVEERLAIYTALYQASQERLTPPVGQRAAFLSLLTLEYGLTGAQVYTRWLRSVIERVQSAGYTPAALSEITGIIQ